MSLTEVIVYPSFHSVFFYYIGGANRSFIPIRIQQQAALRMTWLCQLWSFVIMIIKKIQLECVRYEYRRPGMIITREPKAEILSTRSVWKKQNQSHTELDISLALKRSSVDFFVGYEGVHYYSFPSWHSYDLTGSRLLQLAYTSEWNYTSAVGRCHPAVSHHRMWQALHDMIVDWNLIICQSAPSV